MSVESNNKKVGGYHLYVLFNFFANSFLLCFMKILASNGSKITMKMYLLLQRIQKKSLAVPLTKTSGSEDNG
jgi:hypothetical protein